MASSIMKGQVYGLLTVSEYVGINYNYQKTWLCVCECGNKKVIIDACLKNGNTRSCGCLQDLSRRTAKVIHGQSRKESETPEYKAWTAMKCRCYNENSTRYENWGGRGITVCDKWLNSFENFYKDMGKRPSPQHSLDRFPDNNGNYESNNCRWATKEEQASNKSTGIFIEHNGKNTPIKELVSISGVSRENIINRVFKLNWGIEKALSTPVILYVHK